MIAGAEVMVERADANDVATEEWTSTWRTDWSARKGYGVDAIAVVQVCMMIVCKAVRSWIEDEDGERRGRKRPNKKFYKRFGKVIELLSRAQEVIYAMVENAGIYRACRVCVQRECE